MPDFRFLWPTIMKPHVPAARNAGDDTYQQARVHDGLGRVAGNADGTRPHWQQAIALL
jgi:hypothetical protein